MPFHEPKTVDPSDRFNLKIAKSKWFSFPLIPLLFLLIGKAESEIPKDLKVHLFSLGKILHLARWISSPYNGGSIRNDERINLLRESKSFDNIPGDIKIVDS